MRKISPEQADLIADAVAGGLLPFSPAAVEKDLHISMLLREVSQADLAESSLVFCGGTSLVKAHQAINRMSEDVDFKLLLPQGDMSASARKKYISHLKKQLRKTFLDAGFDIVNEHFESGNTAGSFALGYTSRYPHVISLREEIKVDITVDAPCLPTENHLATTLLGRVVPGQEFPVSIECLSIEETVAEKIASFLRRSHSSRSKAERHGPLIRHVYDVAALNEVGFDMVLVKQAWNSVLKKDALRWEAQEAEFAENPIAYLSTSLNVFRESEWESAFQTFVAGLVAGPAPQFSSSWASFEQVARELLKT